MILFYFALFVSLLSKMFHYCYICYENVTKVNLMRVSRVKKPFLVYTVYIGLHLGLHLGLQISAYSRLPLMLFFYRFETKSSSSGMFFSLHPFCVPNTPNLPVEIRTHLGFLFMMSETFRAIV